MTRDGWSGIDRLLADAFRRVLDAGGWGLVTLHFKRGRVTMIEVVITLKPQQPNGDDRHNCALMQGGYKRETF